MLTRQNKLEKERFNMSNVSKAIKLQEAIDKLHEADALMQEALGASEECYRLQSTERC